MDKYKILNIGEPCPRLIARSTVNSVFHFDTTAGRYNVLCLFGSAGNVHSRKVLADVASIQRSRGIFDIDNYLFTGVSIDPDDEKERRIVQGEHAIRWFWDFDRSISRVLGAASEDEIDFGSLAGYQPMSIVLDERLRVLKVIPFHPDPETHACRLVDFLESLPPLAPAALASAQAPVLVVPRVFEPELCKLLIDYFRSNGGVESGFMREVNGKTVEVRDNFHKRRTDCEIKDPKLCQACMIRIHDRLIPEIKKAFQFDATYMERYMVACYDASTSDHFRPHHDNTTKGTAHRRFAVSLVLNSGEFEGGFLRFPEFGRNLFSPPSGGAVVFSCSLLHEATPVFAGKRYVFLPFLYDDAAAKIREENLQYVTRPDTPSSA